MSHIRQWAFILLSLPFLGTSRAPTAIRGVVFEDGNGNAAREPGEPGLSGVVVSNQIDVVTTGAAGEFTLPDSGTGVVFVRVPATHRAPRGFWRKASGTPFRWH